MRWAKITSVITLALLLFPGALIAGSGIAYLNLDINMVELPQDIPYAQAWKAIDEYFCTDVNITPSPVSAQIEDIARAQEKVSRCM